MIYCIGDSFTFGDELPGVKQIGTTQTPSEFAWPSILSKRLNHPVTNLGRSGCGNTRIIKRAMDCTLTFTKDPIIVAWTSPLRVEFIDKEGVFDSWPGRNTSRTRPSRTPIVKELTNLHNKNTEYWAYRQWLRDILLLQSFFKQYDQPYLMVQSHITQGIGYNFADKDALLKSQIDQTNFLGWPFTGMTEWAYPCPEGPNGHPLELGHEKIADKIYEHIRHLGWVS